MITRYVNTASSAGGDGTTNGTAGATRAFASLREALDSLPGTLVDATTIMCSGTAADTLNVTQAYWSFTTSATNYIVVQGDNTTGMYNTSAYRLEVTNQDAIYNNDCGHVRLVQLQVQITVSTSASDDFNCYRLATANNLGSPIDHRYERCIARTVISGGATDNVFGFIDSDPGGSGGTCKRINCIAYGGCYCGFNTDETAWAGTNVYNYNCTGYGNEFNWLGLQKCINCLSANPTTGDGFGFYVTGSTGHSNNASDESSAVGTSARVNQTFTFVNAAGGDFHLTVADAGARTFGATDPASGLYLDDIDGQTRTGSWDIGADEYIVVSSDLSVGVGALGEPVIGGSTF